MSAAMQPSSVAKPASFALENERRIAWDEEAYTEDEFQQWYGNNYLAVWQSSSAAPSISACVVAVEPAPQPSVTATEPIQLSSVAKPAGIAPPPVPPEAIRELAPIPSSDAVARSPYVSDATIQQMHANSVGKPGAAMPALRLPRVSAGELVSTSQYAKPHPPAPSVAKPAGPLPLRDRFPLQTSDEVQEFILEPLLAGVRGICPDWILPQRLIVDGLDFALDALHEVFDIVWHKVSRNIEAVLQCVQIRGWQAVFYTNEAESAPPWRDMPRLDIVITFTDGSWLRWHPTEQLISSTDVRPTVAMQIRMTRKANLVRAQ